MIEWRPGMAQNDPAGDLSNVTLTLPTPPPSFYTQQQQQQQRHQGYSGRTIKPFPSHNRSRIASNVTRTVSVAMAMPNQSYDSQMMSEGHVYTHHEPPPPMYGEDQVPMSVQMPAEPSENNGSATLAPAQPPWEGMAESRGTKRARSEEGSDHEDNDDGNSPGEELGFEEQRNDTLWQE